MGTELKLIIGERWSFDDGPSMQDHLREFGQTIHEYVTVDLSGVSSAIWALVYKAQEEAEKRFETDGIRFGLYTEVPSENDGTDEKRLFEDRYGKPIGAIKLTELLPVLKEEFEKSKADYGGQGYRRYELAIAIIEVIISRFSRFEDGALDNLVALTWGH